MRPGGKVSIDIADGSQSVTKTVNQLLGPIHQVVQGGGDRRSRWELHLVVAEV